MWEASTGKKISSYEGHSDNVTMAVWSPDSKYVASASVDRTVQVWEATTGKHLFTYQFPPGSAPGFSLTLAGIPVRGVSSIAWSPDGARIVAGDIQSGVVQVWQAP
jgi:WD40 repeat protein